LLGEVDAVILNTPEAEHKVEKKNQQVTAWCLNYWTESNPGGASFYCKLANRAFSQVLLHEVLECSWDSETQTVITPRGQSETAEIAEFENQDWFGGRDDSILSAKLIRIAPETSSF
jgi:hypothetical protein